MTVSRFLTITALACALAAPVSTGCWAGWGTPLPEGMIPAFAVPKMTTAPKIDGTIDAGEWREATAVSGVGGGVGADANVLYVRPTTFWLGWDADHIYMAMRIWVKPGYKPCTVGRSPHSAIVYEDCGEFHFQPMGKNVMLGRTSSSYKFLINTLGIDGDLMRVAVGQQFKNWMPSFKTASRITPEGSAPKGGSWIEVEWSATWQDFELTGPNQAGDQWKFMLGWNHMYDAWSQARIPATTSYFDPGGYPVGTLVENTPAIQEIMEDIPGPGDGVAAVKLQAYNPTSQPVKLSVVAQYADATGDLVKKEITLDVPAGKTEQFVVNEKFPRTPEKGVGTIYYHVNQGSKTLFNYYINFTTYYQKMVLEPAPKAVEVFPLTGTFNPVRSNFQLVADAYYLDKPDSIKSVTYDITRNGDTAPVVKGTIDKPITHFYRRLINMPPLQAGKHTVRVTMVTKDGGKLGPVTTTFDKQNEAKAFPEWWNTKIGSSERVIWPFTPIKRSGNSVSVIGRTYKLNALGLPIEVISQGKPVSAAPARIVVTVNGKEQIVPMTSAPTFTLQKDWKVLFKGTAKGAGLVFTAKGSVEQDGLALVDLTYGPAGKTPVTVDALRIEFPLSDKEAECFLCQGPGGNYAARTTILTPQGKDGVLWTTLDTGKNGSGMTVGSFYPEVWLGNEARGFMWYADNDKGWAPDDAIPAHELIRTNKMLVLRNNIIGKPFTVNAPRTIELTYMASPFKPLPKGWRRAIASSDGTFEGMNKNRKDPKTGEEINGWCWLSPPSRDPAEWSTLWADYKVIADKKVHDIQWYDPWNSRNNYGGTVHTSLPLIGYGSKTPDERINSYFDAEWSGDPWNKVQQDYFLWLTDRAFGEGGLRTIYWDIFFIAPFTNTQQGIAYELSDGRIQPGFNALNIRRFMMRMYGLMGDHKLTPGSQVSHATNCYNLVASPWMDAILDGEYHSITDESGMDWVDGYPIERMRTMSCSENWGTQISWMTLMSFKDPKLSAHALRGLTEWPRMFDTWGGMSTSMNMPQSVLDWGMNEPGAKYIPFWRNPYVTSNDKDVLVSMWQLPDRVMLEVFNYNRKDYKDAELKVDLSKLNLLPQLKWQEFVGVRDLEKGKDEPSSSFDFYNQTLMVSKLEPHTGRLIGIRRY